tara:strand:- start:2091 stop:2267 length:177 start_codon:yes stop_codon:yes gene_type:complete
MGDEKQKELAETIAAFEESQKMAALSGKLEAKKITVAIARANRRDGKKRPCCSVEPIK